MKWVIRVGIVTVVLPSLAIGLLMLARYRPGRGHVDASIEIHRPAGEVFRWISQPERMERWMGGVRDITVVSADDSKEPVGEILHAIEVNPDDNTRTDLKMVITDYVPGEEFGLDISATGNPDTDFAADTRYRLSENTGSTHISFEADMRYRSRLSEILEPLMTFTARRKFQRDLQRLKTAVEAAADDGTGKSSN